MTDFWTKMLRNKMNACVLSILLGLVLILAGKSALDLLVRIIGWMLLAMAASYLAMYFFGPFRTRIQLGSAVLWALIGFVFITWSGAVVNAFPVLMGLYLILNALSNFERGFATRPRDIRTIVLSCVMAFLGLWVLSKPAAAAGFFVQAVGVVYVINGISDFLVLHRVRHDLFVG